MRALLRIVAVTLIAAASTQALAQDYPTRAIRLIVPLTPGSGADIAGRIIAKNMTEAWHQPVVVENRPGAGGLIGTQVVTKSDAEALAFETAGDFPRQALHAFLLGFHHPSLQKTLRFESKWPADFANLVAALRDLPRG